MNREQDIKTRSESMTEPTFENPIGEWEMRNGEKATVVADNAPNEGYPLIGWNQHGVAMAWTVAGHRWIDCAPVDDYDLIRPWKSRPVLSPELIAALPEWANWVAMDDGHAWHWYAAKPSKAEDEWVDGGFFGGIPPDYGPDWDGDWKDSLVEVVRR